MRIPHPPSGLSPAQIAAYTGAFLTLASITVAAGLLIRPLGIILLVLFSILLVCGLVYFGLALYNDHADRKTQRQRVKIGEIVMLERDGVQIVVDPQRAASPALAISAAGVAPLLAVDQAQQARNVQAAAVQLAQAAPSAGGRVAEMIHERTPPAQILTPGPPLPQLEAPTVDLATMTVDLISRLQRDTGAENMLLGVDGRGSEVRGTLHDLMHTGLLAATGGGKTTTLSSFALQLAHDPDVQLVIADPHLMELALLEDTGALRYGLPGNGKQAVQVLTDLAHEVHRRADLVNAVSQRIKELAGRRQVLHRLDRYNRAARHIGAEHLPTLVCFGDEIRALTGLGPAAEKALGTITSEGRKFGVYFVGASQSWKTSVIDSDVRSQFWCRICLPGATVRQTAELFEIDQAEARTLTVQLTAPGVAAFWRRGARTTVLKTPYVELESDRAYAMIEVIAATRASQATRATAPLFTATKSATTSASSPLECPETALPSATTETHNMSETVVSEPVVAVLEAVAPEERDAILAAAAEGKSRRQICQQMFGATGGRGYRKVQSVLNQAGL